ncbi:hypothetical protein RJ640_015297 [Escallonia rubra]|uniref:Uncharacterized protein n=1 Tax=Escallonia rubra TaxID=112253 RepID=A0AA88RBU3_9ASTE|nr:hypothetical protein RJ640_015297 [Escallonia rubra]
MTLQPPTHPHPHARTRTRRLSPCHRHPSEPVTSFCTLCLRERLAGLCPSPSPHPQPSSSAELRRSKSVSAARRDAAPASSEPRRNSCDARSARSTLSHLFNLDDVSTREPNIESKNLGLSQIEEIRASEDVLVSNVDEGGDSEVEVEVKTMKEHIDLELGSRKPAAKDLRDIAGSFWAAASVFNKKLKKWRQKEKINKRSGGNEGGIVGTSTSTGGGGVLLGMPVDRRLRGRLRETQSEVGDYGFGGRRSCDTEPRFSVDAGRISLDESRYSFDEPRASWDGYLVARTIPRLTPMLSVVENGILAPLNRADDRGMLMEERINVIHEDETTSAGSDTSSSQRRSSFDRSSSLMSYSKKTLGLEVDDVKSTPNAKVSPASLDIFRGSKLVITERELRDWHMSSLKDDLSETMGSVSRNDTFLAMRGSQNEVKRTTRWRKVCNAWGFVHRENKHGDFGGNVTDQPVGMACEKQCGEVNVVEKGVFSGKLIRSSSCVSSRDSSSTRSGVQARRCSNKKDKDEFVLERDKSARTNFDNGLLRFHMTPFRSYRRSKSGKSRLKNSDSIARDVFQLN